MSRKPNGPLSRIYGHNAGLRGGLIRLALPAISGASILLGAIQTTGWVEFSGTGRECASADYSHLTEDQKVVCENGNDRSRRARNGSFLVGGVAALGAVSSEVAFGRKKQGSQSFDEIIDKVTKCIDRLPSHTL